MTDEHDEDAELLTADRGPMVLRIALGSRLRGLREDRGISREQAGYTIRGSHAKISRLELGRTGFKERDVRDLLTFYGVDDSERRELYLDMARRANQPGWWQHYNDLLPSWFETYLGLEQAATTIRSYEPQFVPGLLQTADYARAVVSAGDGEQTDRRVDLRLRRQQILARRSGPLVWAIIDESAFRRPVGGVHILRDQIDHLLDTTAALPNVRIQVLPFAAGGSASPGCPFSILRFPEPELPDIVYTEQLTSSVYLDRQRDVQAYKSVMDRLSVQALPPKSSTEFLATLRTELCDRAATA
ncbi:helix-turn-helix transcriptional regulator [Nocardia sp. BMG51109]|uniref:helix-turn-helix domain-containing protein n=1 Tax=Nocardia sp. BMG51109 TaxID=1056816 RepID=UPI0004653692|nr:helix-turn-helix transcriptional regulator [Nocardia sp. BMG51109]